MSIFDEMSISGIFKFGFYATLVGAFCFGLFMGFEGSD